MPATIHEKYQSRRGTDGSRNDRELRYIIVGASDDDDAATTLAGEAPTAHRGQDLVDLDVEEIGSGVYEGIATYGQPGFADLTTGGISFSFDTTGGTRHITQALETVDIGAIMDEVPTSGLINIGADGGEVAGCDIVVPEFKWTETKIYDNSAITPTFLRTIFELTGKVNDDAVVSEKVGTLAAGECRFDGATGTPQSATQTAVTYQFAGSPNRTGVEFDLGLELGIVTVDVGGFHYVWPVKQQKYDDTSKAMTAYTRQINVERVYEEADLTELDVLTAVPP